jgi:hypothetical protein
VIEEDGSEAAMALYLAAALAQRATLITADVALATAAARHDLYATA